jgi:hypothetical protein
LNDISEEIAASMFMVEEQAKQETNMKRARPLSMFSNAAIQIF